MITVIVARSRNGVIGRDGELPWRLPQDLRRFKALTSGSTVVMGRKTFESLPPAARPLPDRRNIVVTANPEWSAPGAETAGSLEDALALSGRDCFVIGGERVYVDALPLAGRAYVSHVDADVDGDAHFPELDQVAWRLVEEEGPVDDGGHTVFFRTYERRA